MFKWQRVAFIVAVLFTSITGTTFGGKSSEEYSPSITERKTGWHLWFIPFGFAIAWAVGIATGEYRKQFVKYETRRGRWNYS